MGHSVAECKEMCQVARKTNRCWAVGHQRHYSVLYDNANYLVKNDVLGDIRHIRALWHRNNAQPLLAKDKNGNPIYDPKTGLAEIVHDEEGKPVYRDSWKRIHTDLDKISITRNMVTPALMSLSTGVYTIAPARA